MNGWIKRQILVCWSLSGIFMVLIINAPISLGTRNIIFGIFLGHTIMTAFLFLRLFIKRKAGF